MLIGAFLLIKVKSLGVKDLFYKFKYVEVLYPNFCRFFYFIVFVWAIGNKRPGV